MLVGLILVSVTVTVSVLAAGAAAGPVAPTGFHPALGGPTVDPADPTAGINDPVADLPVLNRDCGSAQIDVNTTSPSRLMAILHVSGPTADRIIDGRPWQRSIDLISVPGVGPSKAGLLTGVACAAPTTLPVATPLACTTTSGAVDLQSSSLNRIVAATGLGVPTVERLIAARPLPQDLQQVVAPRVPGLAAPIAANLVTAGKVCVTPAPFSFAGTGWRWASSGGGAVVTAPDDLRFALFVPPGATSGTSGAWGKVTPEPRGDLGTFRGNYHIYDPNRSGQVAVRMPAANLDGAGDTMISHVHDDATESFSWGGASVDGPGYATVAVTSLSGFASDEFECLPNAGTRTAIFDCSDSPADESPAELAQRRGQEFQTVVAPTIKPGPCKDLGRVHSSGTVPYGMSCGHDGGSGTTATWTLSNNTGASVVFGIFDSTGAVYQIDKVANAESLAWVPSDRYEALVGLAKKLLAEKFGLLVSGGSMSITRPAGAPPGVLHLDSAQVKGAVAWIVLNGIASAQDIVGAVRNRNPEFALTAEKAVRHCIVDVAVLSGLDAVPGCIQEALDAGASQIWDSMDGRTTLARKLKTGIKTARLIFRWGALFDNAISSALVGIAANRGAGNLSVWYSRPTPPSGVDAGNGSTNTFGGTDGKIINDNGDAGNVLFKIGGSPRAYFVPPPDPFLGAVAHEVPTTDDYYCLAHLYPLRDWLPISKIGDYAPLESADPETCNEATETLRYVTGTETNFILRQFAGADGIAHSWLVDDDSELHPVKDRLTYICLAQKYYVLDGRTDQEIARFGDEKSAAVCS